MTSTASPSPRDLVIPPRDIGFVRQPLQPQAWRDGQVVDTAVLNALSLLFPEGERFFIEAVKTFRERADGKLQDDIRNFIAQESLHSREHVQFNTLTGVTPEVVAHATDLVRQGFDRARAQGPVTMLCVTTALEHVTAVFADRILRDPRLVAAGSTDIERLWLWHALEECEHKGVAYDTFLRVGRGWSGFFRYRVRVQTMILAFANLFVNWMVITTWLLKAQGYSTGRARLAFLGHMFGARSLIRRGFWGLLAWYRPGFHPWSHDNRALIEQWAAQFPVKAQPDIAA